ncbi:MAG: hypothetical protein MUE98_15325 [Rhodobacteraceae bacterium]|nr:hypothetical protein [Paracoccaceae bacterium]
MDHEDVPFDESMVDPLRAMADTTEGDVSQGSARWATCPRALPASR